MGLASRVAPRPIGLMVLLVARSGEGPLELETRRRVFVAINRYPGLGLARLSREAGIGEDLVRYHVRVLEKAGLARTQEDGPRRRVFPLEQTAAGSISPLSDADRTTLSLLRKPAVLRLVVALLDQGEMTAGALARQGGIAPSTATHHLKNLTRAGVVTMRTEGRERFVVLQDRDAVVDLLVAHPPPNDLVQGFIEAWDDLGL